MNTFITKIKSSIVLTLVGLFSVLLSGCCTGDVRTELITLPQDQWATMLNSTFAGINLKINNYTPTAHEFREGDEFAFFKPNDSFLSISSLGLNFNFEVPVQRQEPYSIYVNNINSTSITAGTRARKALLTINLEDEDTEIIGNCVANIICVCGDPHVDLANATIDILLTLGARNDNLVIENVEAVLTSDFSETGPCVNNVCAFACDIFAPDRAGTAKTSIENQVAGFLNTNRGLLENLFNTFLDNQGITGRITSVTIGSSGELFITEQTDEPCESM